MTDKNSVMKWWLGNFNGDDPRGKSCFFSYYNYEKQKWINIFNL